MSARRKAEGFAPDIAILSESAVNIPALVRFFRATACKIRGESFVHEPDPLILAISVERDDTKRKNRISGYLRPPRAEAEARRIRAKRSFGEKIAAMEALRERLKPSRKRAKSARPHAGKKPSLGRHGLI